MCGSVVRGALPVWGKCSLSCSQSQPRSPLPCSEVGSRLTDLSGILSPVEMPTVHVGSCPVASSPSCGKRTARSILRFLSAQQVRPGKFILGCALAPTVHWAWSWALGGVGEDERSKDTVPACKKQVFASLYLAHVTFMVFAITEGPLYSHS